MKKFSFVILTFIIAMVSFFFGMEYKSYQIRKVFDNSVGVVNSQDTSKNEDKVEQIRVDKNI